MENIMCLPFELREMIIMFALQQRIRDCKTPTELLREAILQDDVKVIEAADYDFKNENSIAVVMELLHCRDDETLTRFLNFGQLAECCIKAFALNFLDEEDLLRFYKSNHFIIADIDIQFHATKGHFKLVEWMTTTFTTFPLGKDNREGLRSLTLLAALPSKLIFKHASRKEAILYAYKSFYDCYFKEIFVYGDPTLEDLKILVEVATNWNFMNYHINDYLVESGILTKSVLYGYSEIENLFDDINLNLLNAVCDENNYRALIALSNGAKTFKGALLRARKNSAFYRFFNDGQLSVSEISTFAPFITDEETLRQLLINEKITGEILFYYSINYGQVSSAVLALNYVKSNLYMFQADYGLRVIKKVIAALDETSDAYRFLAEIVVNNDIKDLFTCFFTENRVPERSRYVFIHYLEKKLNKIHNYNYFEALSEKKKTIFAENIFKHIHLRY